MLCVPIYNSMLLSQGTYFVLAVSYLCCPCIQLLKYNAKFSYKKKKKKKLSPPPPTIFMPHQASDHRHSHNFPLYRPLTRTQTHLGSYFPGDVPPLSSLPQCTISVSTQLGFKHSLKLLYHTMNVLCTHITLPVVSFLSPLT